MAEAPLRICGEPGCGEFTRAGRCERHAATRHRHTSKNRSGDPFYSSARWRGLRLTVLRREPLCRQCKAAGRLTPATVVDHVLDRVDHPELAYIAENLQPLCERCHNRKTAKTQASKRANRGTPP